MSDPRFTKLKSDPRFRRPKKKNTKVVVDERFKSVFDSKNKGKKKNKGRKVDKYGRPVSDTKEQEDLKRYYRLQNNDDDENDKEEQEDAPPAIPDLARGAVLLESSDEEDEDKGDSESDNEGFITLGADSSRPITVPGDEGVEIDLDEDANYAELDAQAAQYAKDHPDESEGESTSTGERTRRLAVVNLDWDHVRAHHLYKICSSLVSPTAPLGRASATSSSINKGKGKGKKDEAGNTATVARGKILSVCVYPSDFGEQRMRREEKEGPPPEIFKKKELDPDDVNAKTVYEVGGEEEYDEDILRKYQLERLRYYYAIITCDTVDAASHIYNELEGTELERSANVFDMSFVPDDMTFENEPRDEATEELDTNYNPVEFVTDALRHSKVKLTWDNDDPERNKVTRRALTKKEIEENNFKAYIANTSSEESEDDISGPKKKKDTKASRDKLRSLLLGGNEDAMPEGWGDDDENDNDVDMEITFTPGLSGKKNEDEETTLERYQKKKREKRKKRKEELKTHSEQEPAKETRVEDDFFEAESDNEKDDVDESRKSKGKSKKGNKGLKNETSHTEATVEELALLVASDNPNAESKHFSLKSVIKAEKKKKRKKGRKDKIEDDNEVQEDFTMDVKDERFNALFENYQFAIDPTNPHFKKTKAMTALLEERQKRQKELRGGRDEGVPIRVNNTGALSTMNLQSLVESVKRKSTHADLPGQGKRRKL